MADDHLVLHVDVRRYHTDAQYHATVEILRVGGIEALHGFLMDHYAREVGSRCDWGDPAKGGRCIREVGHRGVHAPENEYPALSDWWKTRGVSMPVETAVHNPVEEPVDSADTSPEP